MRFFRKGTAPLLFKWLVTSLLFVTWFWVSGVDAATDRKANTTPATHSHKNAKTDQSAHKKTADKKVSSSHTHVAAGRHAAHSATKTKAKTQAKTKSHTTHVAHHRTHHRHVVHARPPAEVREASDEPESAPVSRRVPLRVSAVKAMVVHENTGETLFGKNIDQVTPIASVTKLMTAMVVLDRNLPMDEEITIIDEDVDHLKHSSSRLQVGTVLTRRETLQLALMSSENRAAAALGRTYPGGTTVFAAAMNRKAQELGMNSSYFADPTGLNSANVSTAEDLVKMVRAAHRYETIRDITTTSSYEIGVGRKKRPTMFINTNRLVRGGSWDIGVSKTGYINEAGHCLVMQVRVNETPIILVLLENSGKYSCPADAVRIRQWLQRQRLG
ncbi:serine-type D-Ala-D-Ala endopeptidase (penicillin-binding protein 7) [Gammaproteobacteria bacterium]